mgnify:CR=1 FL=1
MKSKVFLLDAYALIYRSYYAFINRPITNTKGQNTSANDFTSSLTVTVVEVLPNGNLLVSGEKQIGLKEGDEFIRFSGVVNPNNVTASNTVQSTQVADARIEYKANGFIDSAQARGWLSRFFLSFLPF